MAKISLDNILSGFNLTKINTNFTRIAEALNSKVLYRNNPAGEPNQMQNALDMNGFPILNAGNILSPSATTFITVKDFGAVGNGTIDDTVAFQTAAALNKTIFIPKGTYRISSPVVIANYTKLIGESIQSSVINYYGTGSAFTTNSEARGVYCSNFSLNNLNGASSTVGINLRQARHCSIDSVEINDWAASGSCAIKINGENTFSASNYIKDVLLGRNYIGIWLTANATYQTNHTVITGGYCYGSVPIKAIANSCGLLIERGDTNYVFGYAVEDLDKGYRILSTDSAGQTIVAPRVEACNTNYEWNSGSSNVVVVGALDDLDENSFGGSGDGFASITKKPYIRLDSAYLSNNNYLRAKTSGGTRSNIVGITAGNQTRVVAPTGSTTYGVEIVDASGNVLVRVLNGNVLLGAIPTAAGGLPSGALWRDAGASNVIKMVP